MELATSVTLAPDVTDILIHTEVEAKDMVLVCLALSNTRRDLLLVWSDLTKPSDLDIQVALKGNLSELIDDEDTVVIVCEYISVFTNLLRRLS